MSAALTRWRERYAHLSWYRRHEFQIPLLFAIGLGAVVFLPPYGRPASVAGGAPVFVFYSLCLAWSILVLADREKPLWLKRCASLGVILVAGWLFYRYTGARWDRLHERFFNLEMLRGVGPMYLAGLKISVGLMLLSAVLSLFLGSILGILRSFKNTVLELFLAGYIDLFRSFPLIALMMVVYYAIPFLGINLEPFSAATVSITLMYSAYIAEIIRAGIEAIHFSQFEAARSLGLSSFQTLRLVVLPQALRVVIPPLTGSAVGILKDTAVAYVVTLPELLTRAQQAMIAKNNPTPLMASSLIYLALLLPLTRLSSRLEARSKKWAGPGKYD
jgi:polar amino acid transport system permease protein